MSNKGNVYPSLVKAGKITVTFENADRSKRAVVSLDYNQANDEIIAGLVAPGYEVANKERHEYYMYQALAFLGSFHK